MCHPTYALCDTPFMTYKLLHVSASRCHPQELVYVIHGVSQSACVGWYVDTGLLYAALSIYLLPKNNYFRASKKKKRARNEFSFRRSVWYHHVLSKSCASDYLSCCKIKPALRCVCVRVCVRARVRLSFHVTFQIDICVIIVANKTSWSYERVTALVIALWDVFWWPHIVENDW